VSIEFRGTDYATIAIDHAAVARLRQKRLPAGTKGLPLGNAREPTVQSLAGAGLNLLAGDLPLPVLVLKESALARNIETMAGYCSANDVLLAPHGKTTMAPQLFERQIGAGCWALTAATPAHLSLYRSFGVSRIFYANQLLERTVLNWLAQELNRDEVFEFYCLVDSPQGVARMASILEGLGLRNPVNVLVEVGHADGRTGCRTIDDACRVAAAVARFPSLRLVGVEAFEGTISERVTASGDSQPSAADSVPGRVIRFLDTVVMAVRALIEDRHLDADGEVIVSAGGSAYFDLVINKLDALRSELPQLKLLLRSGSYITHDGGFYEATSPLGGQAPAGTARLEAALEIWSIVLSRPQPDLLVIGAGKRDLPIDLGPPRPTRTWSEKNGFWTFPERSAEVCGISDQHLHIKVDPDAPIEIGDLCACTISHPCTAFDKWRLIPVVDDDLTIIDAIHTFF